MILSVEGEKKAEKLSELNEFKNVDVIYSSNSNRAIATVKYIAYKNNLKVNVENDLNERVFGIEYINELPNDFIKRQFEEENYKLKNGESLFEVKNRINEFIENKILKSNDKKIVLSMHAVGILAYFKKYCDVKFNDNIFTIIHNGNVLFNKQIGNPDVFKLVFDKENNIETISNIDVNIKNDII